MEAQYVADGVLVRPFEPAATRFLSSRFYDGRGPVDLLEDVPSAQKWFHIMARELGTRRIESVDKRQLVMLQRVRGGIAGLYAAVLGDQAERAAEVFDSLATEADFAPVATNHHDGFSVDFAGATDPLSNTVAELVISAATTVTQPALSRLKKCEGPHCLLYFTQRRQGQQWCSNTCGNRARVARHARR